MKQTLMAITLALGAVAALPLQAVERHAVRGELDRMQSGREDRAGREERGGKDSPRDQRRMPQPVAGHDRGFDEQRRNDNVRHDSRFEGGQRGHDRGDWRPAADRGRFDDRSQHVGDRYDGRGRDGRNARYDDRRHDGRRDDRRYDNRYDGRRHDGWNNRYDARRHDRHDRHDPYRYARPSHYDYRPRAYRAPSRYVHPHGHHLRSWRVGYHLPAPYYARPYYLDYHRYGLWEPPYGHRWVRVGNDVVLVAIASGLIVDVLNDLLYW